MASSSVSYVPVALSVPVVQVAPVPLQPHIEELKAALGISQQNGGRNVALLVKGADRYAATDQSDRWAGHTALLLLLQEIRIPDNPNVYVIGDLSEADLGIFLALVKWSRDRRIFRWKDRRLFVHKPSTAARWTIEYEAACLIDPDQMFLLSGPLITGVPLFALLRPAVLIPNRALTFAHLEAKAKRLFDYMMLSLCASLITQARTLKNGGPSIGAVIANKYGEILSYGNDMSIQLHAETVTIKRLQGAEGHMPDMTECRFYTSLEPCMMCAGFIYESCVHNSRQMNPKGFTVVYLQWDPAVHQVELGPTKITGISTVLNERGLYDLANQLPVMYELEEKRLKLSMLHQKKPLILKPDNVKVTNPNYVKMFEKSATKALDFPSYRRKFAKMKLRLLAMPAVIDMVCKGNPHSREFLLHVWGNILRFLETDCGQDCGTEMALIAQFLNNTRGANPLRKGEEGYLERDRQDFMAFYAEYIKGVTVFLS